MMRILLQIAKWILICMVGLILYNINFLVLVTFVVFLVWRRNNLRKKEYENSIKNRTEFLNKHAEDFEVIEVTGMNADGKNRQDVITRCYRGDAVSLEFKPTDDAPYYVEVSTKFGMIGVLAPYDVANHIGFFRTSTSPSGVIKKLTGGTLEKPEHGCIVSIYLIMNEPVESEVKQIRLNTEMI